MEKQITVWFGAGLLLAVLNFSQAQVIPTYFEVGGKLDLRPTATETITNILWKFNGNLLAEWVKDKVELFYYEKYQGRTTLDTTTGQLVIGKMGKDDVGLYTVEINNKVHGQSYNAKWITRVTKPTVVFRPLTCSQESESCPVTCDGNEPESLTDAEPIEYSWKIGEKDWKMMTKDITITSAETETESIKTISCRMKNPVSQEDSEPKPNPMYKEPPPPASPVGKVVGCIIVVLALVGGGIVLWKFKLKRWITQRRGRSDVESTGDKPRDPPHGDPNHVAEAKPNNSTGAQPNDSTGAQPNDSTGAQPNNSTGAQPNDSPGAQPDDSSELQPLNPPDTVAEPSASTN